MWSKLDIYIIWLSSLFNNCYFLLQKGEKRKSSDESTGEKAAKKPCIFVHDVPNCSDLRSSITKELDGHKLKQIIIKKNKVLDKLYVKIIVASEDTVDEILYKTKALKVRLIICIGIIFSSFEFLYTCLKNKEYHVMTIDTFFFIRLCGHFSWSCFGSNQHQKC